MDRKYTRRVYVTQCRECKRVKGSDGRWEPLEEETSDMIFRYTTCPHCVEGKDRREVMADDLGTDIVNTLVATPGKEFECLRALSPIALEKYKIIIKGSIRLYLQEHKHL